MELASALVRTSSPNRLISNLCRHWERRFCVSRIGSMGEIKLDLGTCQMGTEADGVRVRLEAPSTKVLQRLEGIVAIHLQLMAGNEELQFSWER